MSKNDQKLIIGGAGGGGWNKDVLDEKISQKLTIGGGRGEGGGLFGTRE